MAPRAPAEIGAALGPFQFWAPIYKEEVVVNSPLQQLRTSLGLSLSDFAAMLGVPYNQLHQAENGRQRVPRKAWPALREIGVDVGDLQDRQETWFQDRAHRLREEIKAKMGTQRGAVT